MMDAIHAEGKERGAVQDFDGVALIHAGVPIKEHLGGFSFVYVNDAEVAEVARLAKVTEKAGPIRLRKRRMIRFEKAPDFTACQTAAFRGHACAATYLAGQGTTSGATTFRTDFGTIVVG